MTDAWKRKVAEDLVLQGSFTLSAQVLQEFIANALHKPRLGISEASAWKTHGPGKALTGSLVS